LAEVGMIRNSDFFTSSAAIGWAILMLWTQHFEHFVACVCVCLGACKMEPNLANESFWPRIRSQVKYHDNA
jgi:hypothetical protein